MKRSLQLGISILWTKMSLQSFKKKAKFCNHLKKGFLNLSKKAAKSEQTDHLLLIKLYALCGVFESAINPLVGHVLCIFDKITFFMQKTETFNEKSARDSFRIHKKTKIIIYCCYSGSHSMPFLNIWYFLLCKTRLQKRNMNGFRWIAIYSIPLYKMQDVARQIKRNSRKKSLPHFCYICKSRRQNKRDRKEKVASSTNDNNIARLREVAADLSWCLNVMIIKQKPFEWILRE